MEKKTTTNSKRVKAAPKVEHIGLVKNDSWLEPFEDAIRGRHDHTEWVKNKLTKNGKYTLAQFASGHEYFGLHKTARGWVFREWAPNATEIFLVGDFNNWQEQPKYQLKRIEGTGNWELKLSEKAIRHGDLYKMKVKWNGGEGERIPAWCRRVVQDEQTKIFSAQVWHPEHPYVMKKKRFKPNTGPLLIYECHVGMSQDAEKVGSYREFMENVLPRVAEDGYNCIQVMAIQEHPYYGSFGYHVSSFFAPSSRFGTPEELKELIDTAHKMGLAVIMDIVHSHAVKNEVEGLGNLAGDPNQFFYPGDRHQHPAWDSLCFDYGKDEVIHFLLSNCRYWMEEYGFDGFRFDGVTSMLYYSHGLGEAFCGYPDYFNGHQDDNAICYLTLANLLIHEVNPNAITIAEEVSGMPGLAARYEDGGYGFDYRMAMNIPDYWIKTIKELRDEDWKPSSIFWEVKNRRPDEKTISYCESHDQALVGDKTLIFRLIDADMYWHFKKGDENGTVHRGIALHKMIRLVTAAAINGGYLNFMGNEFGHPEWIDFPREGNGWSYKYARRQWNLVDNKELDYHYLGDFDKAMISVLKSEKELQKKPVVEIWHNDGDQVLAFMRGDLIFVFNFNPTRSFTDYGFLVPTGSYEVVLNTDSTDFGGNGLADDTMTHLTNFDELYVKDHKEWLKLYLPARSAVVLKKN
ncbi:MAG: alpha amylase C-terminal domain-containing protein [Prevotella sp.]|nr:alpha amylase C-terminal domain-containing protein [Prevotella sp.]MCI5854276.1 alpha amylase C-terminal domain-containing protein [Prevotella sp.]MDD6737833.1 alpha amylase C-terminal domain-containing protein [Prevotella sp.]MDY6092522.1 alpha amylase C-terminal domain-containing protein [Prevotella sp.]